MLPLSIGVPLAVISLVGLLLNGYIFLVLIAVKQVSPNNVLLIHLSGIQMLLSLIFLTFSFPPIIHPGSWIAAINILCIIQGFLLTILHPLTLWTICGLNCDRFYAIAAPLHYSAKVTNKKVIAGLISGWITILLLFIPTLLKVAPINYSTNFGACIPNFATSNSLWYAIVFTTLTLLVPGIVIIGCNIKVLMIARYHRHRIAAAICQVALSAQVTITHQRNPFFVPTNLPPPTVVNGPKFRSRSPISSVLQLVGSFIILYLPYYILIMWNSIVKTVYDVNVPDVYQVNNPHLVSISTVLLTISPVINGILYGLKSKTIRKTFQNYWRKKRTKNEINQEIQARTPSTCGSRRPSVTNLGFLTRPLLQRRLSETLIDYDTNYMQKPKMKRIASEFTWRPSNELIFNDMDNLNNSNNGRPIAAAHTSSCNTLQVPNATDNEGITEADRELYQSVRNSFRAVKQINQNNPRKSAQLTFTTVTPNTSNTSKYSTFSPLVKNHYIHHTNGNSSSKSTTLNTANFLLQKVLRLEHHYNGRHRRLSNGSNHHMTLFSSPLTSPRILITRAFSDESNKTPSIPGTPAKERLHRQYLSSSNLTNDNRSNNQIKIQISNYKSLIQNECVKQAETDDSCDSNSKKADVISGGSDSTTISEISHRRYSSLEETSIYSREFEIDPATEEQLLLSWPITRKKYSNNNRHHYHQHHHKLLLSSSSSSKNGIFRPNPIANDRSEEPEVIL